MVKIKLDLFSLVVFAINCDLISNNFVRRNSPRKYRKNSFMSKSGDIYGSTTNGDVVGETEKANSKFMTNNKTPTHKFGDSVVQRHQNQVVIFTGSFVLAFTKHVR